MVNSRGQLKIQQMAFMIIAVFFFFALVGLAFVGYQYRATSQSYARLQVDASISALQTLTDMPELTCGTLCLDEDKLIVMHNRSYGNFWPVASVEVYKIYPPQNETVDCPAPDCNHYYIKGSGTGTGQRQATYASLCRKVKESGTVYTRCELAKLVTEVKA